MPALIVSRVRRIAYRVKSPLPAVMSGTVSQEQLRCREILWEGSWWRMSGTLQANLAMNVQWFEELGLVSLSSRWQMLRTKGNRRDSGH